MPDQSQFLAYRALRAVSVMTADEVREARRNDVADFEARFSSVGDDGAIEGTALRFNVVDSYRTEFAPEAFSGLQGRSIPMLWSHDPSNVIGSWSAISVRGNDLVAKGKLNLSVAKAQEVRSLLQAGDVSGLSIGFNALKSESRAGGVRRITQIRLREISVVAFPAVPGTGVTSVRTETRDLGPLIASLRAASKSLKG